MSSFNKHKKQVGTTHVSSVAFDKIVPFWKDFAFDDMYLVFRLKEHAVYILCPIDPSVDRCELCESRFDSCP